MKLRKGNGIVRLRKKTESTSNLKKSRDLESEKWYISNFGPNQFQKTSGIGASCDDIIHYKRGGMIPLRSWSYSEE